MTTDGHLEIYTNDSLPSHDVVDDCGPHLPHSKGTNTNRIVEQLLSSANNLVLDQKNEGRREIHSGSVIVTYVMHKSCYTPMTSYMFLKIHVKKE